jgi:general stress protein YciG
LSGINSTEKAWRGKGVMSAGIIGTQSPTTNEDPQVNGNQSQTEKPGEQQELTPDRPPQAAVEGEAKPKRPRGFAAMDRKLVSEIARKGGKAAHSAGTAHEFTSEEARVAGRKGGRATHAKRRKAVEGEVAPKPAHEEKPGG